VIYPDGCSDLVVNLGKKTLLVNGTMSLKPGVIYLGGTQRGPINFISMPDSKFYGIRFKPGGFGVFFGMPLYEATGQFIELSLKELTFISNCEDLQVTIALTNAQRDIVSGFAL
jgi:hypothetical protein